MEAKSGAKDSVAFLSAEAAQAAAAKGPFVDGGDGSALSLGFAHVAELKAEDGTLTTPVWEDAKQQFMASG